MNFPLYIARRFYNGTRHESKRKASTPAIRVATIGVAVGLAVMIVAVSVVKGFQREVSRKITGFGSHMEVLNTASFQSPEDYPIVTDAALLQKIRNVQGVAHVQRTAQKMGVLKTNTDFAGISLKGVAQDYDYAFLRESLIAGQIPDFTDSTATNRIVISADIANNLHLKVGSRVFAYFFEETIKMRRFTVAGIYRTNLKQFDKTFVLTDLFTVGKLNDWSPDQSSSVEITVNDFSQLDPTQRAVARLLNGTTNRNGSPYSCVSIKENPRTASTFSWLELLDFNVWVILVLMLLVAGFTMISGLLILILERTATIGLLKALGATNLSIRHTFLWFASFVVIRGLLLGNLIGIGLVMAQRTWGLASLDPSNYYVDKVPVFLSPTWLFFLNAATLLLTILALIGPSFIITKIQPARAIRFE